jgi:uncharacterized cupredoxin-like copper-binding protein
MGFLQLLLALFFLFASSQGTAKTSDLHCMFLGYPELEYDGFDRTEVRLLPTLLIT